MTLLEEERRLKEEMELREYKDTVVIDEISLFGAYLALRWYILRLIFLFQPIETSRVVEKMFTRLVNKGRKFKLLLSLLL